MKHKADFTPFLWSGAIFLICLGLALLATRREIDVIETGQIGVPSVSAGPPLIYFFGLVVLLGVILFLIPISKLRLALRILFGLSFSWGTLILIWLFVPFPVAAAVAAGAGLGWLLKPQIWLHNLLLVLTLTSLGSVFGLIFSPWTVALIMSVIAVYDFLAVRFGYMQWMAQKLSESDTLPAFFIPKKIADWKSSLKGPALKRLFDDKVEKEFSILGGGDIGFPLLLAVSVMFVSGIPRALVVAAFSLLGLVSAYLIHILYMKGKATPALPPIFLSSLVGLLVVRFALPG